MFEIIKGTRPKVKPDMALLWLNAFVNSIKRRDTKKIIVSGVKYVNISIADKDRGNMKEVESRFTFADCVMCLMGQLTPRELMQLFPPDKRYDGGEDCKDYFYTMEFIRSLDADKPIGSVEDVFNFLWDYMNAELHIFLAEYMSSTNSMAHLKGQPGPTDKLIDDMGLDVFYRSEDPETGEETLYNSSTGENVPIAKPKLQYLRLVK